MINCLHLDSFYPSFFADLIIACLGGVLTLIAGYLIYLVSIIQIRKDRLKYVASLIEQIYPSLERQAEYCEKHAELLNKDPFSNNLLKLEANRDPKRLSDKVDQEGVYHAFLWKYERSEETYKLFQELYGIIDYVDFLTDDLIKTNEKNIFSIWERKKKYQVVFKKVTEEIRKLSLDPDLSQSQPELVKYGADLLDKFHDNQPEGENITQSYKLVVQPLQNYIISKARNYPKITELLFDLHELANEYHGIELQVKYNSLDYIDYATSLKDISKKLVIKSLQLRVDFKTKNDRTRLLQKWL